jgi:hypothetical protein
MVTGCANLCISGHMRAKQLRRKPIPSEVEEKVFSQSRRRCAICFYLHQDTDVKKGQIAHLDRRRSNNLEDNLAFLCLEHHSEYDSVTSQHKNYTIAEVKSARRALHRWLKRQPLSSPPSRPPVSVLQALHQDTQGNRPDVTLEVSDETKSFLVKNSGSSVAVDISARNVRVPISGEPSEEYKQTAAKLKKNIQSELVIRFGHVQVLAASEGAVQLPFRVEGWSSLTDLYMLMEIVATPWPSLTPPRKKDAPPWSRTEDENRRSRIGRAIQIQQGVESSVCELPVVLCFSNTGPPKRTWHSHHRLTYSVATKELLCHHDSTDEVEDGVCPYCSSSLGRDKAIDPRLAEPHPDLMLELIGDTTTGTVSLYNRREVEAFNISITELSGEQGVIHWKHQRRLPGKTAVGVKFVIRNLGEEGDRNTSIEHDAAHMIALILHKVYPADIPEEQIEQAFRSVERSVFVKYLDITTKTNWQTLCRFIYSRRSGSWK